MTSELKERIAQIQRGEVPEGCQKTKLGAVPFGWSVYPFAEIASVKSKKYNPQIAEEDNACVELEHIKQEDGGIKKTISALGQASIKSCFQKGNVLYGKLRPYLKKYALANFDGVCSTEIWVLASAKNVLPDFLFYLVQSEKFDVECNISCCGSKMPRADWEYVSQTLFLVPSREEQQKIAAILATQDKLIALKQQLLIEKEQFKKYLCRNLMLGENGTSTKKVPLNQLLVERNDKNKHEDLEICSVAVGKGVVNQIEHLGRSYAASDTSNYNVVSYGDIVYTKSPTGAFPYGIIKQSQLQEDVAVSPLYGVFKPINYAVGYILHCYFSYSENANNYLFSLVQKGAKNTMSISNQTFLFKSVTLPTQEKEQRAIAAILTTADKEIELLKKSIEAEKQKKKGLMQLLLTGIVRVNNG